MVDDYDGPVIFVPAHPNNIRPGVNHPKVLIAHTSEEAADEIEVTPFYFARNLLLEDPPRRASTHYYVSGGINTGGDGDLYQMVREGDGAIANGVLGKPYPADTNASISLNLQSLSLEIEGFAATIHQTCHPATKQWATLVEWIESRSRKYDIPLDRAHVIGHKDVASNRVDPGRLDVDGLIAQAKQLRLKEEDLMFKLLESSDGKVWLMLMTGGGHPFARKHIPNQQAQAQLKAEYGSPTPAPDWLETVPNVSSLL